MLRGGVIVIVAIMSVAFLKRFGAYEDVQKVIDSKNLRAGKGKLRNKRY